VGVNGMRIDPAKVEAVENWEAPEKFKEIEDLL
jgi:hypothetical protein